MTDRCALFLAPAFAPYRDDSPAGSFYLLSRVGRYLKAQGWHIQVAGLSGSWSQQIEVVEFPDEPQADMGHIGPGRRCTPTALVGSGFSTGQ